MRTLAVLPVKRFAAAKQRLAPRLPPAARAELAEAMLADVLAAVSAAETIVSVAVVTSEPRAARLARSAGADVVYDAREAGQSEAATRGIEHALGAGFDRALLLPGDTPLVTAGGLDALLESPRRAGVEIVVVPDRHGTGTNGLLLRPPDALAPSFGPDSLVRHLAFAREASLGWEVDHFAALEHDVDTPEDLDALVRAIGSARPGAAPRTRGVLARVDLRSTPEAAAHAVEARPCG